MALALIRAKRITTLISIVPTCVQFQNSLYFNVNKAPSLSLSSSSSCFGKRTLSFVSPIFKERQVVLRNVVAAIADFPKIADQKNQENTNTWNVDSINENTTLQELGLDSLDQVELIVRLEREFNCEFSDEVADSFKSVRDIVDFIEDQPAISGERHNMKIV